MNATKDAYIFWIFIVAGGLLLAGTVIAGIGRWRFIRQSESATGKVLHTDLGKYHPEIAFITKQGQQIRYYQGGFHKGYRKGDIVPIRYHPATPHTARIDSFGALWGFHIMLLLLGLAFLGIGLFQWWRRSMQ